MLPCLKIFFNFFFSQRKSIQDFQSFAGLNVTGEMNEETVETMSLPRCGVRDKIGHDARRRKRYALQGICNSLA